MRDLLTNTPAEVVEADFAALQATISSSPVMHRAEEPDAVTYWSDVDLAALNVIADAHIPPDKVAARFPALVEPFFRRGRPFLWLTTPSSTTPQLEAALAQAGFRARQLPTLHRAAGTPLDPYAPDDVYIDLAWPDQVADVTAAIFRDSRHVDDPTRHHLDLLEGMDPDTNHFFVARSLLDGQTLGASTMHVRHNSAMLANISTVPGARGRGIARALTATMVNRATTTGQDNVSVVARHGTYEMLVDLGFRTQFDLVTWRWDPRD